MSLKLEPFESLGVVSYSPSIVTVAVSVAVCEIFSVKEWHDLENQVRGRSNSLQMAPFDRPYMTLYWSVIVSTSLFCIISEIKRDIGRKSRFFHTLYMLGGSCRNIVITFGTEKLGRCS